MARRLAEEWEDYLAEVLSEETPPAECDQEKLNKLTFLAGASSILVALYDALKEEPDHFEQVFTRFSNEIKELVP